MNKLEYKEIDGELVAVINPKHKKELRKNYYDYYLKKSKIPKDYWDIEFKHYKGIDSTDDLRKAMEYAKKCNDEKFHNINLYIYGVHSAQKSMVACNIGKEFIKEGLSVRFILAGDLIDLLLKTQGFSVNRELEEEKKELNSVDLLIIDDAFDDKKAILWRTENKSMIVAEWDRFLRNIISNDVRVIITSNFLMSSVGSSYGKSLYELLERNFIQLHFKDCIKDVRKKRFNGIFSK